MQHISKTVYSLLYEEKGKLVDSSFSQVKTPWHAQKAHLISWQY